MIGAVVGVALVGVALVGGIGGWMFTAPYL